MLDLLVVSLLSFLVLSLPNAGSYVMTSCLAAALFAALSTWSVYYSRHDRVMPLMRATRNKFVFGLNLFGVVSALIAARVEGIAGGSILAFASAAIVAVWLLLPSTSEAPPGNA
jgi:hypothetical protein